MNEFVEYVPYWEVLWRELDDERSWANEELMKQQRYEEMWNE